MLLRGTLGHLRNVVEVLVTQPAIPERVGQPQLLVLHWRTLPQTEEVR